MRRLTLVLVFLAVACSPETTTTTETTSPATTSTTGAPTTTVAPTTTLPATTTTEPLPSDATVTVLIPSYSDLEPHWNELFFPYGDDEEHLGTSPGGEGDIMWGPGYGARLSDRSWWFFDAANLRLAHFDEDASYLGQVAVPEDILVNGMYFQWQRPIALDNDWVTGFGYRSRMVLLRLRQGMLDEIPIDADTDWVLTDGTYLYGISFEDRQPLRLDPATGSVEEVDWLIGRDGSRFMASIDNSIQEVFVELPDAGITRTLQLRWEDDPEAGALGHLEVEVGIDGTLHFFFNGATTIDETHGIGGYFTIGSDGAVSHAEPIRDPFSPSDPATGDRLSITPGTADPWLMFIDEDGVRVYTRETE